MTLWLAALAVALLVFAVRPRHAAQRLATWPAFGGLAATTRRSIRPREFAIAIATGSALVALGLPLPIAMGGGLLPLGWARLQNLRERGQTRQARESAVVEATFALAGELRAGRTPSEALRAASATAGPLADVLHAAAESVAVGGSAAAELDAAGRLEGAARLHAVAAAWRVTESAGGRVALVLERLGEAMDRDDALRRDLEAAMAAPKATMMLLAGLPLFGLGLGEAIGAHPLHLLLYRPLGWGLLTGAVLLDAIGIVVSHQITKWAIEC
jgi:tight adherence protein B